MPKQVSPVKKVEYCIHCNQELIEGKAFCANCGEKIVKESPKPEPPPKKEEIRRCQSCGSELIKGKSFCGICGESVGGTAPPPPMGNVSENVPKTYEFNSFYLSRMMECSDITLLETGLNILIQRRSGKKYQLKEQKRERSKASPITFLDDKYEILYSDIESVFIEYYTFYAQFILVILLGAGGCMYTLLVLRGIFSGYLFQEILPLWLLLYLLIVGFMSIYYAAISFTHSFFHRIHINCRGKKPIRVWGDKIEPEEFINDLRNRGVQVDVKRRK